MNLVLMPYGLVIGLWVIWLVVYWHGGWDALHELAQAATRRDQLYLLDLVVMTACCRESGDTVLAAQPSHPKNPNSAALKASRASSIGW